MQSFFNNGDEEERQLTELTNTIFKTVSQSLGITSDVTDSLWDTVYKLVKIASEQNKLLLQFPAILAYFVYNFLKNIDLDRIVYINKKLDDIQRLIQRKNLQGLSFNIIKQMLQQELQERKFRCNRPNTGQKQQEGQKQSGKGEKQQEGEEGQQSVKSQGQQELQGEESQESSKQENVEEQGQQEEEGNQGQGEIQEGEEQSENESTGEEEAEGEVGEEQGGEEGEEQESGNEGGQGEEGQGEEAEEEESGEESEGGEEEEESGGEEGEEGQGEELGEGEESGEESQSEGEGGEEGEEQESESEETQGGEQEGEQEGEELGEGEGESEEQNSEEQEGQNGEQGEGSQEGSELENEEQSENEGGQGEEAEEEELGEEEQGEGEGEGGEEGVESESEGEEGEESGEESEGEEGQESEESQSGEESGEQEGEELGEEEQGGEEGEEGQESEGSQGQQGEESSGEEGQGNEIEDIFEDLENDINEESLILDELEDSLQKSLSALSIGKGSGGGILKNINPRILELLEKANRILALANQVDLEYASRGVKEQGGVMKGITTGNNIKHMFRSQLILPDEIFLERYTNRALLQRAVENEGVGDFYFIIDKSGSMGNLMPNGYTAFENVSAVALASAMEAEKNNRKVFVQYFDDSTTEPIDVNDVFEIARISSGGGTDMMVALKRFMDYYNNYPELKDVRQVFILSDFETGYNRFTLEEFKNFAKNNGIVVTCIHVYGGEVPADMQYIIDEICDEYYKFNNYDASELFSVVYSKV
jgi:hypothetical protein